MAEPPDGGYGWVIVIASFLCIAAIDGIEFSLGVFLPDISRTYQVKQSVAAIPGSLVCGVALLIAPVTSGLINRFGSRIVLMSGCIITSLGMFVSVFCTSFAAFCFFYGIIPGIGHSLILVTAQVEVGFYFEKRRALATGIAMSGSGVGVAVVGSVVTLLTDRFGWQGTQWILAAMLMQCVVFGALMRPLSIDIMPRASMSPAISLQTISHADSRRQSQQIPTVLEEPDAELLPSLDKAGKIFPKRSISFDLLKERISSEPTNRFSSNIDIVQGTDLRLRLLKGDLLANHLVVNKPFARSDIFYTGSVQKLPEYLQSTDLHDYRRRTVSMASADRRKERRQTVNSVDINGDGILAEMELADPDEERQDLWSRLGCGVDSILNFGLLKDPDLLLLIVASILTFLCMFIPFFYTSHKALAHGASQQDTGYLLLISGLSNSVGRVSFGWIADHCNVSALTLTGVTVFLCGCASLISAAFDSFFCLCIYMGVYGFLIAAYPALTSIVVVQRFGLENLTSGIGFILMARGVAVIVGSPIGGAVYDATDSYMGTYVYAGVSMILSASVNIFVQLRSRFLPQKN